MFKSSRKKLIAIGCSYTADWNSFPPWPTLLAEMLDMECFNLSICGSGNDQILAKTVDVVLKEKNIGLVVLMWSEWQRMGFQKFKNWDVWHHVTPHIQTKYAQKSFELQNPRHATRNALRTFIHAEKLLRDVPYMFIQGTHSITYYNVETSKRIDCSEGGPNEKLNFYKLNDSRRMTANEIIISPYLNYIEKNIEDKFIGWPTMSELGGYCFSDILDKKDPTRTKLRISKDDYHPNGDGHKLITKVIYDNYKKIYL